MLRGGRPSHEDFFEPKETICAIVTCGGLCPGLNDVIRSVVMQAYYRYGVPRTLGIPYGFEGLIADYGHRLINLTPTYVTNIHRFGGTTLWHLARACRTSGAWWNS